MQIYLQINIFTCHSLTLGYGNFVGLLELYLYACPSSDSFTIIQMIETKVVFCKII